MKLQFIFAFIIAIQFVMGITYGDLEKTALQYLNQTLQDEKVTECTIQLRNLVQDFSNQEPWALIMVDSTAKWQPGIIEGNLLHMGEFDECLSIDVIQNGKHILGQYCSVDVYIEESYRFVVDDLLNLVDASSDIREIKMNFSDKVVAMYQVCVPATCTVTDLQSLWTNSQKHFDLGIQLVFTEEMCTTIEKLNQYTTTDIAAICFFVVIGTVMCLSTIYDVSTYQKNRDGITSNFWISFSVYTNTRKLILGRPPLRNISCLNGIRVISMIWIIFCHEFLVGFVTPNANPLYAFEWEKRLTSALVLGGTTAIDSMFMLSGFLVFYVFLYATENGIKMNIMQFYIHRYLRLTPALAALIIFQLGVATHVGSGPVWMAVDITLKKPCETNWWKALLYFQNDGMILSRCILHGWYLDVDTHLYLLSPLFLLPILRWPVITVVFMSIVILASAVAAFAVSLAYNLGTSYFHGGIIFFKHMYLPAHMRMPPWLIGGILGYYMFQMKNKTFTLPKATVYILWSITLTMMLVVILGFPYFANNTEAHIQAGLYNAFSRIVWSLCLCWIIFACVKDYGGFINRILSCRIFEVMSKLTYGMYLTHLVIIILALHSRRTPLYNDNLTHFHNFWGNLVFTLMASYIWTLAFESPVIAIQKLFLKKKEYIYSVQAIIALLVGLVFPCLILFSTSTVFLFEVRL